jgi:hypothetical protein
MEAQLLALQERFPGSSATSLPSGAMLIRIPNFKVPGGWNKDVVEVRFLAPVGYPYSQPDCFWADEGLRLANGGMPQNSNISPVPETTDRGCWFSWHLGSWTPGSDTLMTFVAVINDRFRRAN